MDELVNTLSQKTGLSADKARMAVDTVVNFIKSKLPDSVSSQIDSSLSGQGNSISEKLGGMLGKNRAA